VKKEEALSYAGSRNLHIVEVGVDNDFNVVCKVVDDAWFEKDEAEGLEHLEQQQHGKKQDRIINKEILITVFISENDFQTKVERLRKFMEKRVIVKVKLDFRGRRGTEPEREMARETMANLLERVTDVARMTMLPRTEGNWYVADFVPQTDSSKKKITPEMVLQQPLPLLKAEIQQRKREEELAAREMERLATEKLFER